MTFPAPLSRRADEDKGYALARRIARRYENFSIASLFLPAELRQDLRAIYAFCRLADDYADENRDAGAALASINRWEAALIAAAEGKADEPLFAALGRTIRRRRLSLDHFRNLLEAFRMDLVKTRYATWAELREYTRLSADPVGRIVLELTGFSDYANFALSDQVCTGLQLTNHWQDICEDYRRGRVYIPLEDMERFGVSESDIAAGEFSKRFGDLMWFEVRRARDHLKSGWELARRLKGATRRQIMAYTYGGWAALDAIERAGGDVLNRRTRLSNWERTKAIMRAWF